MKSASALMDLRAWRVLLPRSIRLP
jgi:hypothetical protein